MKFNPRKLIFPLIITVLLIIVLYRTFYGSFDEVFDQITSLGSITVLIVLISSLLYQVTEGLILTCIMRKHVKSFSLTKGVLAIFQGCFYRGITFGTGTQAGQVYYLYGHGVQPSHSMSSITLSYAMHKIGMFLYITFFLAFNFSFFKVNFGSYISLIVIGFLINTGIIAALLLLSLSRNTHRLIIRICTFLFKKEKHKAILQNITEQINGLSANAKIIINDFRLVVVVLVLELIKFSFWYIIPYFILGSDTLSLTESLSVTSFSNSIVGIIPLPSGIMSTELTFTALFAVFAGKIRAGAAMIVYRFATYIFPFLLGILLWIGISVKKKIRKAKMSKSV